MSKDSDKVSPIEIQSKLGGLDYPAKKEEVVDHAKNEGAGDDVINVLRNLKDRKYDSPADVMSEYNQAVG